MSATASVVNTIQSAVNFQFTAMTNATTKVRRACRV